MASSEIMVDSISTEEATMERQYGRLGKSVRLLMRLKDIRALSPDNSCAGIYYWPAASHSRTRILGIYVWLLYPSFVHRGRIFWVDLLAIR